jgi:hypothetical protein
MRFQEKGEIDRELAWDTDKPVTAEELYQASYPDSELKYADTGFERLYNDLANAMNAIKGMFI